MTKLVIFTLGVLVASMLDLIVQWSFKAFGGKHLKRSRMYHLFLNLDVFVPILGGVIMLLMYGSHTVIKIFFASAIVGTFGEYLFGRFFFFLHGRPVWEYQYLPIGRFTSWVSILYWGGAGLLFVKIAGLF